MKTVYRYFFRGLITFLPVALTVYLLYLFVAGAESMALWLIRPLIGDFYLPGVGLVVGIGMILVLGFVVSHPLAARMLSWVELPFTRLPVVKSIYSSLKNFADYFSPQETQTQQVVVLRMPGQDLAIVGLVTRHSTIGMPAPLADEERVAVYLPMGYMIGGYTVFVPRSWTEPLAMTVEGGDAVLAHRMDGVEPISHLIGHLRGSRRPRPAAAQAGLTLCANAAGVGTLG